MTENSITVNNLLQELGPRLGDAERKEYFNFHYWRFAETLKECTHWANGKVLDVGVVPGHMAMALRRLGCEVHGITDHEISGHGRYGEDDLSRRWTQEGITLHNAVIDREVLPLPDNFFDGVIFTEVLEHLVYNPKTLIREIHRILKPNGEVVVSTPNVARVENRIKALIGWNVYPRSEEFYFSDLYKRHNREYTLREVEDLFCPPFKLKTARYIMPYEFAIPVSNRGHVYDSREYAEIAGGRPQSKTSLSATSLGRRALRWCKSVYPPFRSCLLLSFIAEK